ncbi:unnamed protein product [Trichogramma brassicae]|uniref:Uncharacterized protein n=1 Tax=Trichogramma brassicae TaxID=86971 RepID=A0A6H5IDP7_9HYME|nr:unnamed protein product [Trichogramma brassicae]
MLVIRLIILLPDIFVIDGTVGTGIWCYVGLPKYIKVMVSFSLFLAELISQVSSNSELSHTDGSCADGSCLSPIMTSWCPDFFQMNSVSRVRDPRLSMPRRLFLLLKTYDKYERCHVEWWDVEVGEEAPICSECGRHTDTPGDYVFASLFM